MGCSVLLSPVICRPSRASSSLNDNALLIQSFFALARAAVECVRDENKKVKKRKKRERSSVVACVGRWSEKARILLVVGLLWDRCVGLVGFWSGSWHRRSAQWSQRDWGAFGAPFIGSSAIVVWRQTPRLSTSPPTGYLFFVPAPGPSYSSISSIKSSLNRFRIISS